MVLNVHRNYNGEDGGGGMRGTQSQDSVYIPLFLRDRRAKAESSLCPSACQLNALPLGPTGSH